MSKPSEHSKSCQEQRGTVAGDPGIGGLLADPLAPAEHHDMPDPKAGTVSPDPAPPRRHGNWMPPGAARATTPHA
jgi:hypothetical protein